MDLANFDVAGVTVDGDRLESISFLTTSMDGMESNIWTMRRRIIVSPRPPGRKPSLDCPKRSKALQAVCRSDRVYQYKRLPFGWENDYPRREKSSRRALSRDASQHEVPDLLQGFPSTSATMSLHCRALDGHVSTGNHTGGGRFLTGLIEPQIHGPMRGLRNDDNGMLRCVPSWRTLIHPGSLTGRLPAPKASRTRPMDSVVKKGDDDIRIEAGNIAQDDDVGIDAFIEVEILPGRRISEESLTSSPRSARGSMFGLSKAA